MLITVQFNLCNIVEMMTDGETLVTGVGVRKEGIAIKDHHQVQRVMRCSGA